MQYNKIKKLTAAFFLGMIVFLCACETQDQRQIQSLTQELLLSELMTSGGAVYSPEGENCGWVELYNSTE